MLGCPSAKFCRCSLTSPQHKPPLCKIVDTMNAKNNSLNNPETQEKGKRVKRSQGLCCTLSTRCWTPWSCRASAESGLAATPRD